MTQDATGGRPSLDALNRTIEGLESRLSDLMEARPSAQRPAPRRFPEPQQDRFPRERAPMPNPGSARVDAELREIGRTLKDLRASVREDFSASLRDELSGLHTMLSHLDRQTDTRDLDEETRGELIRISEAMDWLVANAAADDDSRLMAEFDHLQSLLRGLADAKSINRLESRFENIERQLAPFDASRLDAELTALARGIDELRRQADDNDSARSLEDIENRLSSLAQAMEVLCTRFPSVGKKLDGQIGSIERRIDDINRNLESLGRRQGEPVRDAAIERLEGRLSELASAVTAVDWQMRDQGAKQQTLLENLDGMARRIEGHRGDEGHLKLEARIEKLAAAVERIGPGVDRQALGKAVSELSEKIGRIDVDGAERRISEKIEASAVGNFSEDDRRDLKAQLDRLAGLVANHGLEPRALDDVVSRINDRISRIDVQGSERRLAAKLDSLSLSSSGESDREALRDEIRRLSGLIENGRRGIEPAALDAAVSRINDSISRIDLAGAERRLSSQIATMPARGGETGGKAPALDTEAFERRLAARIDALDLSGTEERLARRIAALEKDGSEDRLSAQLSALANRFEESRRDTSAPALAKLERQIAELTTLVSRPDPKLPLAELEERIGARIDSLTASNDDYLIEAAQHAAEEALKNFEQRRKGEADEHIAVIKALAADMKNLQQAGRDSAGAASLHDTLKTIAGRLDTLNAGDGGEFPAGEGRRAETGPFVAKAPTMPQQAGRPVEKAEIEERQPPRFETRFPAPTARPAQAPAAGKKPEDKASDDVLDILSRVRAGQKPEGPVLPIHDRPVAKTEYKKRDPGKPAGVRNQRFSASGPQGDLIAAARRAARSALANAEDMTPSVSPKGKKDGDGDKPSGDGFSRRPVYLAAGAILLAIMAYPFLTDLGRDRETIMEAVKTFEDTPPSFAAPSRPTANGTAARSAAQQNVASAPSLRAPEREAVKTNFAAEAPEIAAAPAARAFRMIEADNTLVTGSINPDAPVAAVSESRPAPGEMPVETPVATAPPAAKTRELKAPVETASVTTKDVLDMLAAPTAAREASAPPVAAEKPAAAEPPQSPAASLSAAPPPEASGNSEALTAQRPKEPAPLDIAVPKTIKPEALADAARGGNAGALYEIGMRFQEGLGLTRDPAEAAVWFDEAAERGSAPAAFQLGSLYEKGIGVDRDPARAITLYRTAARAGNVSAMHNLAVMLANGAGSGKPDFAEAAKWFGEAAEHGVADSQFNLAILHARGAGVDADLAQSYKWFAIAAVNGDTEAAKRRNEVAEALSEADLNRGRKLAADWQAREPLPAANRVETPAEWLPQAQVASASDKEAIIRDIQSILNERGYDAGPEDGLLGARTDAAIKAFQAKNGLVADGAITPALVETLLNGNSV
ncbi:peptidoglycan-binding protein [Martelella radicis]|uniref:Localization factor PodJL n=1 Tax=Martelella radicis TaxID=1397476 RepID=A0A7W6KL46_9HYPH|nr:peptidoglycan-binding protein [Martelella radicis]MBB4123152.1 localization factor PodJL [Martelella radicis]